MGVTPNGGNAVFLVDSTLKAAGEGTLQAERQGVRLRVHRPGLGARIHHEDGDSLQLRVDEIRKVKMSGARALEAGKAGATADAAVGSPRRFVPLMLADLVVVASDKLEDSNATPTVDREKPMRRTILICLALALRLLLMLPPTAGAAPSESAKASAPTITRVTPMRVRVGALLTIRGRNFKAAARRTP